MVRHTTDKTWLRVIRTDRVWQLMIVNLLVFLGVRIALWCGVAQETLVNSLTLSADFSAVITHPWTLIAYMFTQYDVFHFTFNMMWLWIFGIMIMRFMVAGRTIIASYLIGGLFAAVVWITLGATGVAQGVLMGSSAAVLAVMASAGVILWRRRVEMMFFGEVQVRWLALGVIILCMLTDGTVQGAATVAVHMAGVVAGVLIAVWNNLRIRLVRKRYEALGSDDQAELDALLKKVHNGGYGALSSHEKQRLFAISSRLSRK